MVDQNGGSFEYVERSDAVVAFTNLLSVKKIVVCNYEDTSGLLGKFCQMEHPLGSLRVQSER